MEQKPGVMIYFDMLTTLQPLTYREKGILFEAMLLYARDRHCVELPPRLQLLWPMIQLRLDFDHTRYLHVSAKRRYATYSRWAKRNGETPMPYADWISRHGMDPDEEEDKEFSRMQLVYNIYHANDANA